MPRRRKEPFGLWRKEGSQIWQIDFSIKGRGRFRASSGTSNHARAKELAQALFAREHERTVKGDRVTVTFAEAVMLYLSRGGSALYTKPLVEHFKDKPLVDIHPGDIRAAALSLYPNCSAATRNRQAITPARAIINVAAEAGLCSHIRVKSFKTEKPKRTAVNREWLRQFTTHAEPSIGALALFMATTAARIGQAVAMQWTDIDFPNAVARIPPAKGHGERFAKLPLDTVVALANLPRQDGKPVFGYRHRWSVYKLWRVACAAAKIKYVPPHQAGRHTFATEMVLAGVDPKTVAERGGWKSLRLMLETYAHATEDGDEVQRVFDNLASSSVERNRPKKQESKRKSKA